MKAFKIDYSLKNGASMSVGVIADNREQAVEVLLKKQINISNISGVSIGWDLHVMSDNVKQNLIHGRSDIKKLKDEIQYLKNCLMDSDDEIEKLRLNIMEKPIINTNIDEVSMLHEKIVQLEIEKEQISKGQDRFICPECLKQFKNPRGVKMHFNKMHKEGFKDE